MESRLGIRRVITGLLVEEIEQCNTGGTLALDVAEKILKFLEEEGNLNLQPVMKCKPLSKDCDIKFHDECDCGKYCTG